MARENTSAGSATTTTSQTFVRAWGPDDLITGFRRGDRTLITGASHEITSADVAPCPPLRGSLVAAPAVLDAAARDQGRLVAARPGAVLFPADSSDIAAIVRWCADLDLPVAPRGSGHTCHGQGLVGGGVSIAMRSMDQVHDIGDGLMRVDGGVEWLQVVRTAAAYGQRPPSVPGYLGLTVGGTLSVGGISAIPTEGAQVDRVHALEVVTGGGELVSCSRTDRPELFWAALAGLGQVGIITRADLELIAAPSTVRGYVFAFDSAAAMFAAARRLLPDKASELYLRVMPPTGTTPTLFTLIACAYQYGPHRADQTDEHMLNLMPAPLQRSEHTWLDYVEEVTHVIGGYQACGWDDRVKVWSDLFLPDHAVQQHVEDTVAGLTPEEWGAPGTEQGFVLVFPHRRGAFTAPLLRLPQVPDDEFVWLFDVLSVSPDHRTPGYADRLVDRNHQLADAARASGGTVYPIGVTPMSTENWRHHYGPSWTAFERAKNEFDPKRVLTPGPGIFEPAER